MLENLFSSVDSLEEQLIHLRRDFHRHAETGWTEFRTTARIMEFLSEQGISYEVGSAVIHPDYVWSYPSPEVIDFHRQRAIDQGANPLYVAQTEGYTGVVATIDTGREGPTVAFRFDMDCNDIQESCDPQHRPHREGFSSINPNCTHGCGHDGHTAMGLIFAAVLQQHRRQFSGTIKIIYQPAEEGDKGAQAMVERGVLADVTKLFGIHIYPTPESGKLGLAGTQMGLYATTKFDITIHGKNSHAGAYPQDGSHAIMAAVMAISAMNGFLQDGRGATRLNIGTIQGGSGRNVIPDCCTFRAETRGSTTQVEKRLFEAAQRCVQAACDAHGCTFDCKIMGYGPCGDGDIPLAETMIQASQQVEGLAVRQLCFQNTGGTDDFTYMMERVTEGGGAACYMALLTDIEGGLHNSGYDFDEGCLALGVKQCLAILWQLEKENSI